MFMSVCVCLFDFDTFSTVGISVIFWGLTIFSGQNYRSDTHSLTNHWFVSVCVRVHVCVCVRACTHACLCADTEETGLCFSLTAGALWVIWTQPIINKD